jgi:hypothetical protein
MAILDVLGGAQRLGRRIGGAGIVAVVAEPKPDKGPPPPAVVTVVGPGGHVRIAFEVHSDDARATHKVLQRLVHTVDEGRADLAVLIREAEVPIGEGAKASMELAARLAERGGGVIYVDKDAALRLVGAEKLLDAASSAEVLIGDDLASRDDALTFLLDRDDLGAALVPMLSRAGTTPPRGAARSAS